LVVNLISRQSAGCVTDTPPPTSRALSLLQYLPRSLTDNYT
jgi:hypothetical protein